MTDVSSKARVTCLDTWGWVLIDVCVQIGAQSRVLDPRETREGFLQLFRRHESPSRNWRQAANGHAVASDDEGVTALECPHDFGIVVAQLALSDRPLHSTIVAQRLQALKPQALDKCWRDPWAVAIATGEANMV